MNPKIIFQEIAAERSSLKEQRIVAHSLLFGVTGKDAKKSKTGRPIIDKTVDVSISHKNDLVCVGIVPAPYRIGIDVEHIKSGINAELFLKYLTTEEEAVFLVNFCREYGILPSSGVAIIWSIKEAFFKCLDYDLMPMRVSVINIFKNNEVKISYSNEIKSVMSKRGLEFYFAKVTFNEKHICSQVIMKRNATCPESRKWCII